MGEEGLVLVQVEDACAPCLPGNCLLQRAAEAGNEAAALFLATSGAQANHRNKWVSVMGGRGGGQCGSVQVRARKAVVDVGGKLALSQFLSE